jgi:AraC family transcriptional regulator, transcriptional activator of pobA
MTLPPTSPKRPKQAIPSFALYGEDAVFPDLIHIEEITDRAAHLNWTIAPHRHLHLHQVVYMHSGAAQITLDGARSALSAQSVVNLPSGCVHSFHFAPDAIGTVLTFPVPEWPEYFGPRADCAARLSRPFTAVDTGTLGDAIALLRQAYRSADILRTLALRHGTAGVLLALLQGESGAEQAGAKKSDPRMARLRAIIDAAPSLTQNVATLAAQLGLSQRQVARLCHSETGRPVQALLHSAILREACRELAYTRLHIAQIAHRLGFEEPSYFSRFFQRLMGETPSQYRARMNG